MKYGQLEVPLNVILDGDYDKKMEVGKESLR